VEAMPQSRIGLSVSSIGRSANVGNAQLRCNRSGEHGDACDDIVSDLVHVQRSGVLMALHGGVGIAHEK
jgi:hypothetical protein